MTEAEWLACADPDPILRFTADTATARKWRLFAVACCRSLTQLPWSPGDVAWRPRQEPPVDHDADEQAVAAVLVAERYADAAATVAERQEAEAAMSWVGYEHQGDKVYDSCFSAVCGVASVLTADACARPAAYAVLMPWPPDEEDDWEGWYARNEERLGSARRWQADLARCIFGNPFRPVTFSPEWRTATVLALAQGIYDDRAFDRLPILADALQDAGCDADELLAHCRDEAGPHARGCWAVDAVLGKG